MVEAAVGFFAPSLCSNQCNSINDYDFTRTFAADDIVKPSQLRGPRDSGTIRYMVDLDSPMSGLPLRVGEVLYMQCGAGGVLSRATLALYANGFTVNIAEDKDAGTAAEELSIAWSPFALVQACRLHSLQADLATPLRLFKVSVFHHGSTHFFAVEGDDADVERTRWVADLARALRLFTQSLFHHTELVADPVPTAPSTGSRVLAGYLLKCERKDVVLVYAELHALRQGHAEMLLYEDDSCTHPLLPLGLEVHTPVSEHVAVDCSCFTLDTMHFTARTSAEKSLWLRVISNLKVKMVHSPADPTTEELVAWRSAIAESIRTLTPSVEDPDPRQKPLLPRRFLSRRPGMTMSNGDCDNPTCDRDSRIMMPRIVALGESP